jgi:hypothetical protein
MPHPEKRTYEGRCHCGAVRFRFRSEELNEGRRCNCSMCVRKGAVMSARYYQPDEFEIVAGREALSVYLWGDRMVNHYFCRHCGIYPFHDGIDEYEGRFRVNLGCVEGVDVFALEMKLLDGKSL